MKTAGPVGGHIRMPVVITQSVRPHGKNRNVIKYVQFNHGDHVALTNKSDL